MSPRRSRPLALTVRRLAAALAVGALTVGVAACGSSSSAAGTGTSASDSTRQAALLKFSQCMRAHGVNVPDPTTNGGPGFGRDSTINRNDPKVQAAFQACRPALRGAIGNITPAQRQAFQAAAIKFASCLRSHGINVPDPQFNNNGGPGAGAGGGPGRGGPPRGGFLQQLNRNDPATQAAMKACQSNLPARPGGGGPIIGVGPAAGQ